MVKRPPGELDHQQALGATWLVAASHLTGHGLRPHNGEKIGKDRKKKKRLQTLHRARHSRNGLDELDHSLVAGSSSRAERLF